MAKKAAKKATKKKTTRRKKNEPSPTEQWETLKDQVDLDGVKSYTMNGTFQPNTAINHPKFGVGVVVEAQAHKIEVAFEDGSRFLVHNR